MDANLNDYIKYPAARPEDGQTLVWNAERRRLDWGEAESGTTLYLFSAYDSTGGLTVGTSAVDIDYDAEVIKDNIFSHTLGVAGVTIQSDGFYRVDAGLSVNVSAGATVSYVDTWLANNGVEIPGTRTTITTRGSGERASCSVNHVIDVVAGNVIKMRAQLNTAGNTIATVANGSRMSLTRVGGDTNPGVSGSMLDFSDADNSAFIPFV